MYSSDLVLNTRSEEYTLNYHFFVQKPNVFVARRYAGSKEVYVMCLAVPVQRLHVQMSSPPLRTGSVRRTQWVVWKLLGGGVGCCRLCVTFFCFLATSLLPPSGYGAKAAILNVMLPANFYNYCRWSGAPHSVQYLNSTLLIGILWNTLCRSENRQLRLKMP